MGSVGDSYDNALAETVIGLYKTEVIRRRGPWRNIDAVEYATLEWVDWFTRRRLLEPPATFRRSSSRRRTTVVRRTQPCWLDSSETASGDLGAVHARRRNAPGDRLAGRGDRLRPDWAIAMAGIRSHPLPIASHALELLHACSRTGEELRGQDWAPAKGKDSWKCPWLHAKPEKVERIRHVRLIPHYPFKSCLPGHQDAPGFVREIGTFGGLRPPVPTVAPDPPLATSRPVPDISPAGYRERRRSCAGFT